MTDQNTAALPWFYFGAVCATWGSSFLFMKLALQSFDVFQVAFGRNFLGAVSLAVVLLLIRRRPNTGLLQLGHTAVVAVFFNVVPALLYAWAETGISSGLASIYNATTPVMTLLVTVAAFRTQRPHVFQVAGIGVGMLGVLIIALPEVGTGAPLLMHLACLGSTACYGVGYVYLRHFLAGKNAEPVSQTALQLGIASVLLLPTLAFSTTPNLTHSAPALLGIGLLGAVGTGLCYVWNNRLIGLWGAARASMTTYVTPAVGVLLGVVLLGEQLKWNLFVGLIVVLLSILLSNRAPRQIRRNKRSTAKDNVLINS